MPTFVPRSEPTKKKEELDQANEIRIKELESIARLSEQERSPLPAR